MRHGENGRPDSAALGIALMLVGILLFTLNDTLGKWLVVDYAVGQLLLLRSIAAMVVLAPAIWRAGPRRLLLVDQPLLHGVRVLLIAGEVAAFYWSVRYLPLADVTAIYMACPLFVTALSVPLLGEAVGPRRWAAVAVGFAGVLLILQPSSATFSLPAIVALTGSLLFALIMVVTRQLRAASGLTLITWQTGGLILAGAATVPFAWTPPGAIDFMLLASLGIVATIAHMCVNRSLREAPAAVVVPFQYTMIIWAVILGMLVFGDRPTPAVMAGAALIIASGLYVFARERKVAGRPGPAAERPVRGEAP